MATKEWVREEAEGAVRVIVRLGWCMWRCGEV
jgi:hypothetical protein